MLFGSDKLVTEIEGSPNWAFLYSPLLLPKMQKAQLEIPISFYGR